MVLHPPQGREVLDRARLHGERRAREHPPRARPGGALAAAREREGHPLGARDQPLPAPDQARQPERDPPERARRHQDERHGERRRPSPRAARERARTRSASFVPEPVAGARAEPEPLRRQGVPAADRVRPRARSDRDGDRLPGRQPRHDLAGPPDRRAGAPLEQHVVPGAEGRLRRPRLGARRDLGAVQRRPGAAGALLRDRPPDDEPGRLLRPRDPVDRQLADQRVERRLQQEAEAVHASTSRRRSSSSTRRA